jgi:hypothetical protein
MNLVCAVAIALFWLCPELGLCVWGKDKCVQCAVAIKLFLKNAGRQKK